jgi:hypothetical protein
MAFCTSCGSKMDDGARFCPSCGAHVPGVAAPSQPVSAAAAPSVQPTSPAIASASYPPQPATVQPVGVQPVASPGGGSGVIKIILIIVVIFVGLGILAAGGLFWAAHKVKQAIRIQQNGESSTVQIPGMSASSNADAKKVARDLGVDVYPGAKALEGASSVTLGSMTVGTAQFETSDPIDKVQQFYTARFPRSQLNTADENSQTLLAMTDKGMLTIVLEREGDRTKINISRTGGKGASGDSQ